MKKTKNNKGNIINGIIIAITVIILLCYMFFVDGIDNIIAVFQNAKLLWLVAGALCMVLYWAIEAAIVHCATKCFPQKLPYRQVFQTTMIGQFFNCVTPVSYTHLDVYKRQVCNSTLCIYRSNFWIAGFVA